MIILHTKVILEAMSSKPNPAVRNWLNNQAPETLFLSSTSMAEVIAGLKDGRSRVLFERLLNLFKDRILPFDVDAVRHFSLLTGHGLTMQDGYIAGIAASRGYLVAAQDGTLFEAAGLTIINPWRQN